MVVYGLMWGFLVVTGDFGPNRTCAESPKGAGDDSVLKEWGCLVRRWRSQRQFKLIQLPDGQLLQAFRRAPVGFIRRHTLQDVL